MRYRAGTAERGWCTERTAWRVARARDRCAPLVRVVGVLALTALIATTGTACRERPRDDASRERQRADASAPPGGVTSEPTTGATSAAAVDAKPICPATGTWQMCAVIERLERAGLAPRREEGLVREAPLSSPGVAITLGRSELRVFLYPDRAARERDQARLDRTKYVSPTQSLSMQAEPTLIASENLLAILRSRSDHQRERVSDALTAGPPQRPGTKG